MCLHIASREELNIHLVTDDNNVKGEKFMQVNIIVFNFSHFSFTNKSRSESGCANVHNGQWQMLGNNGKKGSNSIFFLGWMFAKRIRDIFSSRNLIHQIATLRVKAAKRWNSTSGKGDRCKLRTSACSFSRNLSNKTILCATTLSFCHFCQLLHCMLSSHPAGHSANTHSLELVRLFRAEIWKSSTMTNVYLINKSLNASIGNVHLSAASNCAWWWDFMSKIDTKERAMAVVQLRPCSLTAYWGNIDSHAGVTWWLRRLMAI